MENLFRDIELIQHEVRRMNSVDQTADILIQLNEFSVQIKNTLLVATGCSNSTKTDTTGNGQSSNATASFGTTQRTIPRIEQTTNATTASLVGAIDQLVLQKCHRDALREACDFISQMEGSYGNGLGVRGGRRDTAHHCNAFPPSSPCSSEKGKRLLTRVFCCF